MHRILPETLLLIVLFCSMITSPNTLIASVSATEQLELSTVLLPQSTIYQHQNITHNGDLLISNNEALTITGSTFYMNGTITIRDTSTLTITNSNFTTAPYYRYAITLEDNASLIITNTTLIFKPLSGTRCEIQAKANSKIVMSDSRTQNQGYLTAFDYSQVHVNNSTLVHGAPLDNSEPSGVAAFGNSTARIENSTMNGVFVWDDSTVSVRNSKLGIIRTGWDPSARTTISVTYSKMDRIEILDGSVDFHVENSKVNTASANSGKVLFLRSFLGELFSWGTSEMTFIDSSYGSIKASDGASVFVGWHLPLLGLFILPYAWISIIQIGSVLIVVAAVIIGLVMWHRKRRQNQEQDSSAN